MFPTVKSNSACCCCVKLGQTFFVLFYEKEATYAAELWNFSNSGVAHRHAAYEISVHLTKSTYRTLLYQLVVTFKVFFLPLFIY